ncbi:hypothetical protein RxyAA322_18770 [Rubrobacter xylanophilus]|uniref:Gram-positive cocci surface proteins LPxTG domain-containing protein n=1 Tax=Rubrobacter xylanophilus TaxID=49319 RepID=A0A510HN20_9ACTN|nr:hypothetical protein [Rubrobacter xylanophilus]BBL80023.1 hypothetical protein RxyAA322_18770 [Rubrobacter xylanophilus]
MLLAAMLAMVLVAAAPALAQDNAVSGDVQVQNSVCAQVVEAAGGQANLGSSGASAGDIGSAAASEIAQELGVSVDAVQNCLQAGGDINVAGGAEEENAAAVQYQYAEEGGAAAAAAGVLPETGGASLLALGAGALLVAGGLLARRIVR